MGKTTSCLLDRDEIEELSLALNLPREVIELACPPFGAMGEVEHFSFIGWMLSHERCVGGHGIDVSLLGREQARQATAPYSAMAYTPDGAPAIEMVMSPRGPAVSVALAIIAAWKAR